MKLTGLVGVVALVVSLAVRHERRDAAVGSASPRDSPWSARTCVAGTTAILTPMDTAGSIYSRESVWRLVPQLGHELPATHVALAAAGLVVCWVLFRSAAVGSRDRRAGHPHRAHARAPPTRCPGYVGWALPTAALQHRGRVARIAAFQAVVLVMAYEIVRQPVPGAFGAASTCSR